jgi:hypothetical protein
MDSNIVFFRDWSEFQNERRLLSPPGKASRMRNGPSAGFRKDLLIARRGSIGAVDFSSYREAIPHF